MKERFKRKNDTGAVRNDAKPHSQELSLLALQLAECARLNEKLLYRVQQLERREKSLRDSLASVRREITRLKGSRPSPQPRRKIQSAPPPREETVVHPPQEPSFGAPSIDFGSALKDLN